MATVKISIHEEDLELYQEEAKEKGISVSKCISQHLNSNACSRKVNALPKKRVELKLSEDLLEEMRQSSKAEGKSLSRYIEDILTAKGTPKQIVLDTSIENGLAEKIEKYVSDLEAIALLAKREGLYDADILSAVLEAKQMKADLFTVIGDLIREKMAYRKKLQKSVTYKKES